MGAQIRDLPGIRVVVRELGALRNAPSGERGPRLFQIISGLAVTLLGILQAANGQWMAVVVILAVWCGVYLLLQLQVERHRHALTDRRLAAFADWVWTLAQHHSPTGSFETYEWLHEVSADGHGRVTATVGIRGEEHGRSWWRYTFGIVPGSLALGSLEELGFVATDAATGERLRALLYADGPHSKEVLVLLPKPVLAPDVLRVAATHTIPRAWEDLVKNLSDRAWITIERPVDSFRFEIRVPEGLRIMSFRCSPSIGSVVVEVRGDKVVWTGVKPEQGRYDWELRCAKR